MIGLAQKIQLLQNLVPRGPATADELLEKLLPLRIPSRPMDCGVSVLGEHDAELGGSDIDVGWK